MYSTIHNNNRDAKKYTIQLCLQLNDFKAI